MQAFGDDACDEEIMVSRPVRERNNGWVELLNGVGFSVWRSGRNIEDEVRQSNMISVRIRSKGAIQQGCDVKEEWRTLLREVLIVGEVLRRPQMNLWRMAEWKGVFGDVFSLKLCASG